MRASTSRMAHGWQFAFATIIVSMIIGLVGCTRTVTGGFTDSFDKKYRVYGRVYGAYRRSYNSQTAKIIQVSIVVLVSQKETLLLEKKYRVTASSLCWDATWDKGHNLKIVLFDYGPGVDSFDGRKGGYPTNHIRTLFYRFDAKTGNFIEETAQ